MTESANLSREAALAELELPSDASLVQIEQRYALLIRRYRHLTDAESAARLAAANAAYAVLEHAARPQAPVDPRMQQLIFGKTRADWQNRWYYGRWTFLAIIVGLSLLTYLIVTIATNRPADFKILAVGDFGPRSQDVMISEIEDRFEASVVSALQTEHPEIREAEIEWISLAFNDDGTLTESLDPTLQQNLLIKVIARLGSDDLDVILLDRGAYQSYAAQAIFADLTPVVAKLASELPPEQFAKIEILRTTPQDVPERLSGIDVSSLGLLDPMGLSGDSLVLTVGPRSKKPELAFQWLLSWLSSSTSR